MAGDTKISNLAAVTSLDDADLFTLVHSATNNKITVTNLLAKLRSEYQWRTIPTASYTATPTTDEYDGATFTAIAVWQASTAYILGDFVRPTTANGYVYECVTAGTTDVAEPAWGTTLGADTADNTASWRCRGVNVITTSVDLSATLIKGTPLKYTFSATDYYGIVIGVSSTRVALAGAPLKSNVVLTALYYGPTERVVQLDFYVDGTYGDGAADLLSTDNTSGFDWRLAKAYLVQFHALHSGDDTGTEPWVNAKVAGSLVGVSNTNAGLQPGTTWQSNSAVAVNVSNYDIEPDDAIEVRCTTAGGTGDAQDLTFTAVFVLQ